MTLEQLERDVAELKAQVAGLLEERRARWPPQPSAVPLSEEEVREMEPYQQYIRQTGDSPPPFWKPGDPIPEPDWWEPTSLPPDLYQAHLAMEAYGRYYRLTGKDPPPDWKPGDPIPEPDEEWCPR